MTFRRVIGFVVLAVLSSGGAVAENLLLNANFEGVQNEQPVDWSLYVEPQPGAFGRADVIDGDVAALLHTPLPYQTDPMNNWSQNVERDLAGAKLRLTGMVKTREAGGAGLLAQCWQRSPGMVLLAANTFERTLQGIYDWTPVETTFTAPPETDFVTVRCVLRGTGSAWFDDVALEIVEPAPPRSASPDKPMPAQQPPPRPTKDRPDIESRVLELQQLQTMLNTLRGGDSGGEFELDSGFDASFILRSQMESLLKEMETQRKTMHDSDQNDSAARPPSDMPADRDAP